MGVEAVYLNNSYAVTGDGLVYFEGQCENRSDISTFSTDYIIGSKIVCTEDWSLWVLGRNSGTKEWLEVDV